MRVVIKLILVLALLPLLMPTAIGGAARPGPVDLAAINPRLVIDLKYATADNWIMPSMTGPMTRGNSRRARETDSKAW